MSDDAVVTLARELGWRGEIDDAALSALTRLLDDEVEQLSAPERAGLRDRLGRGQVVVCEECGNLTLPRYAPDDGRCRVCAAALGGAAPAGEGEGEAAGERGARASLLVELSGQIEWAPLERLGLGKPVRIDADNEDWDQRTARLERERDEERRRVAEESARKAREEDERRKKASEEAARKAAEEEARRKQAAEEEARRKQAAEEEARRKAAEEEARRKAAEEAERKRREEAEAARQAAAEAERKRREEEERQRREAEEAARKAAEEEARRQEAEEASAAALKAAQMRPALGAILGPEAGQILRLEDLPAAPALKPGEPSRIWIGPDHVPRITVAAGMAERVNGQKVEPGTTQLAAGQIVTLGPERAYVLDQTGDLEAVSAPQVHFARADNRPGGPWPYWNEAVRIGAAGDCEVRLVDDAVHERHALVSTRFGRIVLEDTSPEADGVWVKGRRMRWMLLKPGLAFSLGKEGAQLTVKEGEADLQPKGKEARAQKPTRHNRVLLEVQDEHGKTIRKVFVFARREIRFGRSDRDPKTGKVINELALVPTSTEGMISTEQGGLNLTRDGVDVQRWRQGDAEMLLDDEPIKKGEARPLARHFTVAIGDGMLLDGRVFRSPSDVVLAQGPPRLGVEGGHPFECVRLDRIYTNHTYVFLVRMLRLGSGRNAPVRVDVPGVLEGHAQVLLKDGKYLILAPKGQVTLEPPGQEKFELEAGIPAVLPLGAKLGLGRATVVFRTPSEQDFEVG